MNTNTTVTTNTTSTDRPSKITNAQVPSTASKTTNNAFQPETTVTIQNSLENTLEALSKTIFNKSNSAQEVPDELRKLVNIILQNSFSVDESISQGLSNILQGQKVCIDQLNVLSKVLEKLSLVVAEGETIELSEAITTFLDNLKKSMNQDSKLLDTTKLNKLALQLLEGKTTEDIPEILQSLLIMSGQTTLQPTSQVSFDMSLLKQLIKQFMPTQSNEYIQENMVENKQETQMQNSLQKTTEQQITQLKETRQFETSLAKPQENNIFITQKEPSQQGKESPKGMENNSTIKNQDSLANQVSIKKENFTQSNLIKDNHNTGLNNKENRPAQDVLSKNLNILKNENNVSEQNTIKGATSNTVLNENQLKGKQAFNNLPLINSNETVKMMKNLAQQFLNTNTELSEHEFSLLKDFVNSKQNLLTEKDVKILQKLIDISQETIPFAVKQAANRQQLPELTKLWAFIQLCDLNTLKDLSEKKLKDASKSINDFTKLLKNSMQNENQVEGNQRSMSFMTPLYLGDNENAYPAHIHIYHQEKEEAEGRERNPETWLKICLLTEHIGAVELVFRLFDTSKLDLRIVFSDDEASSMFKDYRSNLKKSFDDLELDLNEIKITTLGE